MLYKTYQLDGTYKYVLKSSFRKLIYAYLSTFSNKNIQKAYE